MAGHSKWANIKHKKEKADAQKGKIYTKLSRLIMVAAREGGGDPDTNPRLKDAIQKAKAVNMPNENINRAILRGTGELEGVSYEEMVYEGYGPGGGAVLIELMTDNRNRTAGEIRHIFDKYGGSLGESGCVAWMFDKKGIVTLEKKSDLDEGQIMMEAIEAGAEDIEIDDENIKIITAPDNLKEVQEYLIEKGFVVSSAELTLVSKTTVTLSGDTADRMMKLLETLEENDDVQNVYCNVEFSND
ncbi:MAG: YebC/PmpR family DNA-binding transcriptional regulator [Firmicutes bacterium]|jgi:YebC/PmpR family DNA-binding regulatory protein|nr:YebC/PmpR family DNA-binding transcriptional regulator [Bacillota bacterium]